MAELRKSLGVWDVVLFNITAIVGFRWISVAAAGGNTSMTLWVVALAFFFLPQAFAVIELARRMPEEGGVYLWTRSVFGDFHGFMAGWCYWTNNLVYFPNLLVYLAGISVFMARSGYQELGESKPYVMAFSLLAILVVTLANVFGLQSGRWVHNVGGIGTWVTGAALLLFGAIALVRYGSANPMPAGSFFADIISSYSTPRSSFTFFPTCICLRRAPSRRVSSLCGGGGGSLLGGNPEGHRALIAQSHLRRLKKK